MAATETVTLNLQGNALQQLQKLEKQVGSLGSKFLGLRNAIGSIALTSIIANTFKWADSIYDVSKATNIATANVLGFTKAVQANGGTAEDASNGLTRFVQNIGEAKDGTKNAITAFNQIGISISDIARLSEQDLLAKVIENLDKVDDAGKRTRLQVELLGKSFRGVDMKGVAGDIGRTTTESRAMAESIAKAAQANDKLEAALTTIKGLLVRTLEPLAEFINSLNTTGETFTRVFNAIKTAGAVLLFIVGVIIPAIRLIKALRLAWIGVTTVFADTEAGIGVIEFFKNWTKWAGKVKDALAVTAKEIERAKTKPENIYGNIKDLEKQHEKLTAIGEAIKLVKEYAVKAGLALATMAGAVYGYFKEPEEPTGPAKPTGNARGVQARIDREKAAQAAAENEARMAKAFTDSKLKVDEYTKSLKKEFDQLVENFTIQKDALKMGEKLAQIKDVERQVTEKAADARKRYEEMKVGLDPTNENDKKLIGYINAQINAINGKEAATKKAAVEAVKDLQAEQEAYNQLTRQIDEFKRSLEDQEVLQSMKDELSLIGLVGEAYNQQAEALKVNAELRKKLNDLRAEENALTTRYNALTAEGRAAEKQAYDDAIADINKRRAEAEKQAKAETEINKQKNEANKANDENFLKGLKDRLQLTKEQLTAYNLGSAISDSIINAIETGKFHLKSFLGDMLKMWLAQKAKLAAIGLFDEVLSSIKSATGGSIIGNIIGAIFGKASGGPVAGNKPYIVGEKGPELFVPNSAGSITPNNKMASANNTTINNYNVNAVDAKSVAQLFAENRKALLGASRMAEREMPYAMGR